MTTPFGYNPIVLGKCLRMPDVSLTDLIYHYLLAKLIECGNNKYSVSRKIGLPVRTLRTKMLEVETRGYPIPRKTSGKKTWSEKDKIEYENRTGLDCKKRRFRSTELPEVIPPAL